MKKIVKIVLFSVLGLSIAGFAVYSALAPIRLELAEMKNETARLSFAEQGIYTYRESFELYPLMAGEVVEVLTSRGARVAPGDPIVMIEAADIEFEISKLESLIAGHEQRQAQARGIEQEQRDALLAARQALQGQITSISAQIQNHATAGISLDSQIDFQHDVIFENQRVVSAARRALRLAEDTDDDNIIVAAQANLAHARQMLAASQIMLEQLSEPVISVEFFTGQLDALRAEISGIDSRLARDSSAPAVSALQADIEGVYTQIEQLRFRQGKTETVSPVGGVVTQLNTGSNLTAQNRPLAVIEWDPLIEVFVSTRDLDSVNIGGAVSITIERRMGDQIIGGIIAEIESEAQARLSPLGVEERKVRLFIRPDTADIVIGAGVEVSFPVFERENSIIAPKTAIFQMDGSDMAWIVREGVLALIPVQRGVELREGYLIESGLSPGDLIVRDANTQGLSQGKRVAGSY